MSEIYSGWVRRSAGRPLLSPLGEEAQPGDGVAFDGEDFQLPAVDLDGLALLGQAAEAVKDQASHGRVRPVRQRDAKIGQVRMGKDPGRSSDPSGWRWMARESGSSSS